MGESVTFFRFPVSQVIPVIPVSQVIPVIPVSPVSPVRLAHLWVDFRVILDGLGTFEAARR